MDNPVDEIFSVFLEGYLPAKDLNESDVQMTTSDIVGLINDFHGEGTVDGKYVYEKMKQAGYTYRLVIRQLMWLLIER
jgi:hypothetical protein